MAAEALRAQAAPRAVAIWPARSLWVDALYGGGPVDPAARRGPAVDSQRASADSGITAVDFGVGQLDAEPVVNQRAIDHIQVPSASSPEQKAQ